MHSSAWVSAMYPALRTEEHCPGSLKDGVEAAPGGLQQRRRQSHHDHPPTIVIVLLEQRTCWAHDTCSPPPSPEGYSAPLNLLPWEGRAEQSLGKAAAAEVLLCVSFHPFSLILLVVFFFIIFSIIVIDEYFLSTLVKLLSILTIN